MRIDDIIAQIDEESTVRARIGKPHTWFFWHEGYLWPSCTSPEWGHPGYIARIDSRVAMNGLSWRIRAKLKHKLEKMEKEGLLK